MILVWLLEANYTLNILVFLYWWQIILWTFPFFFTGSQVADTYHTFTKYSKLFLIQCLLYVHFPTKLAAVTSFSYKIGGSGLIFLQNWRRRQGFGNITGSYSDMVWILAVSKIWIFISFPHRLNASRASLLRTYGNTHLFKWPESWMIYSLLLFYLFYFIYNLAIYLFYLLYYLLINYFNIYIYRLYFDDR